MGDGSAQSQRASSQWVPINCSEDRAQDFQMMEDQEHLLNGADRSLLDMQSRVVKITNQQKGTLQGGGFCADTGCSFNG